MFLLLQRLLLHSLKNPVFNEITEVIYIYIIITVILHASLTSHWIVIKRWKKLALIFISNEFIESSKQLFEVGTLKYSYL